MVIWSLRASFFCSSVYSCHLFLVSSASIRSIPFLFFVVSFVVKCFLGISNFLDENSSLSHSIISLYFFDYSLKERFFYLFIFWSLLAILWNSAFKWVYLSFSPLLFASLVSSAIRKSSSDSHFGFLHFFFLGIVLITPFCSVTNLHHSASGTLSQI